MILIGSQALKYTVDLGDRLQKADYDVIMSVEDFQKWAQKYKSFIKSLIPRSNNKYKAIIIKDGVRTQYEIELGFDNTSSKFLLDNEEIVTDGFGSGLFGETYSVLTPEFQFLTKKSHIVFPVHWEKNIEDYHLLKALLGKFELTETMQTYFKLRSDEAKERYSNFKTPKLNVTNEDFFSSKLAVEHYFIHDDIHEMVKHHDKPIYEMMKRDFSLAKCEKDMFFQLSFDMQVQCVQEEAYTIALERYIVPKAEDWSDYKECYRKAVKRICTTLCSGWFREFAYENYPKIMEQYDSQFVAKFNQKVLDKQIKPIDGKDYSDILDFYPPEGEK